MSIVNDKTNPLPYPPTFIKYPSNLHKQENPEIVPDLFQIINNLKNKFKS